MREGWRAADTSEPRPPPPTQLHLGCENPFACPRCHVPTSGDQLMEYVRLGLKLLLCCACFGPHCCCFEGLIAREDAKVPPPRLESPAA